MPGFFESILAPPVVYTLAVVGAILIFSLWRAKNAGLPLGLKIGSWLFVGLAVLTFFMGGNLGALATTGDLGVPANVATSNSGGGGGDINNNGGDIIASLVVSAMEKGSNSATAVGNASDGFLDIFPHGTNPSDPNAVAISRINVTSGTATYTGKRFATGVPYRITWNGGAGWVSLDCNAGRDTIFDPADYNPYTSELLFDLGTDGSKYCPESQGGVPALGTISDMIDENSTTDINGQTALNGSASELGNDSGADTLVYDESEGDGGFFYELTYEIGGTNAYAKDLTMGFRHDQTNTPEANDVSALTSSFIDGSPVTGMPTNLLNHWANQQSVILAPLTKDGFRSQWRFTYTVSEANLDTSDEWYHFLDDNGGWQKPDFVLNRGITGDQLDLENIP